MHNELLIKLYSQKELAEWLQITPQTFYKNKEKYLTILKRYADYEIQGKKVYIKEVYNPYYEPLKADDKRRKLIEQDGGIEAYIPENGYTTIAVMAQIYSDKHNDDHYYSIKKIISTMIKEKFGKFPRGKGPAGSRTICWCKVTNHGYIPVTDEEHMQINDIYKKYIKENDKTRCAWAQSYVDGEITSKEFADNEVSWYLKFLNDVTIELGFAIKTVTHFELNDKKAIKY